MWSEGSRVRMFLGALNLKYEMIGCDMMPSCFSQLQIQFVLTVVQTTCAVVWPCGFPMGWLYFQISYMVTLIILFLNFYVKVNS